MNDANNFQISKGNIRQISAEERAFMDGVEVKSTHRLVDSTPGEEADGITRMVPDCKGGFRPVSAQYPTQVSVQPDSGAGTAHDLATVQVQPSVPQDACTTSVPIGSGEDVIRIHDAKKRVDLMCKGTFGDEVGVFSVGMSAVSVDIAKEGISILVRSDVDVCPPALCRMKLHIDGEVFDVLYAGGKHRLGGYINMPFVKV